MERRKFITLGASAGIVASALPSFAFTGSKNIEKKEKRYQKGVSPWPVCLDTATIRPASLKDKIKIAAKAGYDAIEPWDNELQKFEAEGGNLKDLGKEIKDSGLFVPSVIGLWNALPPTKELWEESLKDTRNRMRMAADIGAQHIQTIPNTVGENYNQKWVADRYRDIIEIGLNDYKIYPALVFVKYFPVKTMGQAAGIALDANHPHAMIILDVYHMYISEGGFEGIKLLRGEMIAIFQFNAQIFKDLKGTNYKGCVSLEMYNPKYWKEDLQVVADTGLRKTLEVLHKAAV